MSEWIPPAKSQSLLRVGEVARRVGMSPRHIWRLVKMNRFPQPIQFGRRCKRWSTDDIDAYIRDLAAKAKNPPQSINPFDLSQYQD